MCWVFLGCYINCKTNSATCNYKKCDYILKRAWCSHCHSCQASHIPSLHVALKTNAKRIYIMTDVSSLSSHRLCVENRPRNPESRLLVHASKRHFVPVWASLNRGFRGLVENGICAILSLPNEDWGRMNKRGNPDFEGSTFHGREYSIWATNHWKVSRKSRFHLWFILPKSSFGEHKFNCFGKVFFLNESSREASIKLRNFRPPLKERSGAWCEYSYLGQILHELDKPRMIYAHVWKFGPNVSTHTILKCVP